MNNTSANHTIAFHSECKTDLIGGFAELGEILGGGAQDSLRGAGAPLRNREFQLLHHTSSIVFLITASFLFAPHLRTRAEEPGEKAAAAKTLAATRGSFLPSNQTFVATAEEMDRAMQANAAATGKDPLQFPKGNGVRLLMTGHSFVAPAVRTLPLLAAAAGFDGHHQRAHTSGGSTGAANAIWLTEFGKFRNKPAAPILLPAIATGQWDMMSWGAYFGDAPEHYTQWIEVCLKHNPTMTFLVQDGWPMVPRDAKSGVADALLPGLEAQDALEEGMLGELCDDLDERYPGKIHLIPAGLAVMEMVHHYYAGELPGVDCLSEHLGGKRGLYRDGGHLSNASGMDQLVGYLYFGMLYRQSPERVTAYQPKGVDPAFDRLLRQAAWHAIVHSPYSGITDKGGKGLAD